MIAAQINYKMPGIHRTQEKWTNYDNTEFYELVKATGLKRLAIRGGLATGCDIKLLTSYWQKTDSILEVGAGYGRAIDHLLKDGFSGQITAIERSNALFKHLKNNNYRQEQVKLLNCDLHDLNRFNFNKSFDLILWLWSGIADFSTSEQLLMLRKLRKLTNEGGMLVIDTLPASVIPLGMERSSEKTIYSFELKNAKIRTFSISQTELIKCATAAGFNKIQHVQYFTDTTRERYLHLIS